MTKEIIKPQGVFDLGLPYNQVVKAGEMLFLSNQRAIDLQTGQLLGGHIRQQTQRAMDNVKLLLESAGSTMNDIVKVVVYMKDIKKDFYAMNDVYSQYFSVGNEPARVAVQALSPIEDLDIEIEVVATVSE